jgi:hypothetical protein
MRNRPDGDLSFLVAAARAARAGAS